MQFNIETAIAILESKKNTERNKILAKNILLSAINKPKKQRASSLVSTVSMNFQNHKISEPKQKDLSLFHEYLKNKILKKENEAQEIVWGDPIF